MMVLLAEVDSYGASSSGWLLVKQIGSEELTVAVIGGAMAQRAEELWSSVEYALEVAAGGLVTLDLAGVTGFDHGTIDAVHELIKTAVRRRDGLEIILLAGSALEDYIHTWCLAPGIVRSVLPQPAEVSGPSGGIWSLTCTRLRSSGDSASDTEGFGDPADTREPSLMAMGGCGMSRGARVRCVEVRRGGSVTEVDRRAGSCARVGF
jgi:hypothetical protein